MFTFITCLYSLLSRAPCYSISAPAVTNRYRTQGYIAHCQKLMSKQFVPALHLSRKPVRITKQVNLKMRIHHV
jgi:hypothetical protein